MTPNSRSVFSCWDVVKHSFIHSRITKDLFLTPNSRSVFSCWDVVKHSFIHSRITKDLFLTPNSRSVFSCWDVVKHSFIHSCITKDLFLTPNSRSVSRAGVSLNVHSLTYYQGTPVLQCLSGPGVSRRPSPWRRTWTRNGMPETSCCGRRNGKRWSVNGERQ